MATQLIKVTRDHIEMGQPGNCDTCPIALSIMENLGSSPVSRIMHTTDFLVLVSNIAVTVKDRDSNSTHMVASLPSYPRMWIENFDDGFSYGWDLDECRRGDAGWIPPEFSFLLEWSMRFRTTKDSESHHG